MNKKIIVIGLVIVLAVAAFFVYDQFLGADAQKGEKEVTVQVIAASQNIDKTFVFNTDTENVYDLLMENQDALKVEFIEGGFVSGLLGYTALETNKEYFSFIINGEFALTGAKDTLVKDGDVYKFELATW